MPARTQDELDPIEELCSFQAGVYTRLPGAGKTIMSARPREVAFYEDAFQTGMSFPIRPILRKIMAFYNVCPA